MEFCIEKFSSALCLAHGTQQSLIDLPEQCYILTENSKDVYDVIRKLSKIFQHEFQLILKNIMSKDALEWFDLFMKANLSRYVKMSENASYFHFMLVCSLIHTISSGIFHDLQCFTLVKITSLCLRAVYDRCYRDLFEKEKETGSLGFYCKRINIPLLFDDDKSLLPADFKQEIKSMLLDLTDIDYWEFEITDLEERMLDDSLELVPPEGIPNDNRVSTNMSCESPSVTDKNRYSADDSLELVSSEGISNDSEVSSNISRESLSDTDMNRNSGDDFLELVPTEGISNDSEVSTNIPRESPSVTYINRNLDEYSFELVPTKGISNDSEVSMNMSCESLSDIDMNLKSADEIHKEMNFLNLDENLPNIEVCDICDGKCLYFLLLYRSKNIENIKSSIFKI